MYMWIQYVFHDSLNLNHKVLFFRRVCKIAKGDYLLRHVCPSVRSDETQLSSQWTDFVKFFCASSFLKCFGEVQSSKSDEIDVYFTWTATYICDNIWLNTS